MDFSDMLFLIVTGNHFNPRQNRMVILPIKAFILILAVCKSS